MSAVARRYYTRGRQALDRGDVETAMDSFRSAMDLAPLFSTARIGYAVALTKFGDCPRAAQVIRAGLARPATPVSLAALWATLGDVLVSAGDFFGAEDAYKQAGAVPGFEARAESGLARVYGKLGRYPEAVAQLKRVAERCRNADNAAETDRADRNG